ESAVARAVPFPISPATPAVPCRGSAEPQAGAAATRASLPPCVTGPRAIPARAGVKNETLSCELAGEGEQAVAGLIERREIFRALAKKIENVRTHADAGVEPRIGSL